MPFSFLHSTLREPPILIPAIGLDLRVRVPPEATGGVLTAIETVNATGFGPPLFMRDHTVRSPVCSATDFCMKYIAITEITVVATTIYPTRSKCLSEPSAFWAMIAAARTDPSPPESCCKDAPTALKEPR